MDWLKLFSVLLVLIFFNGEVIAGSRKTIRIHVPQKVKYIHHHKKIYITKYPGSTGSGTLQHYGPTEGQYAPGYTSASSPVPVSILPLSEDRTGYLSPNLQPLYRARGHYGPPPMYGKSKRATRTRSNEKRKRVVKASQHRRKRVPRKKLNKKPRESKKYTEDYAIPHYGASYNDYSHNGYNPSPDQTYEFSEAHPTTFKSYKMPKRVQKYVDKDGEHIHTYTEEHIHQYVYDEPPSRKPSRYSKNSQSSTVMPLSMALQEAYQAGNPASSSSITRPSVVSSYSQSILAPSVATHIASSVNHPVMSTAYPTSQSVLSSFPSETQYFGFSPMSEGYGSMGTPTYMEYMDYNPKEATYDHLIHDHGEFQNPSSYSQYSSSNTYKENPFLNQNIKPLSTPVNRYKASHWSNVFDSSIETGAMDPNDDFLKSHGTSDFINGQPVTSVSFGKGKYSMKLPSKYNQENFMDSYSSTTTKKPFNQSKSPKFRPRPKPTKYPTSIASLLNDETDGGLNFKQRPKYQTTELPTTSERIPYEYKGVFDQKLFHEKHKSSIREEKDVEGVSYSYPYDGNPKDLYKDEVQGKTPYRSNLKDSYGYATSEELDYDFGHLLRNKNKYPDQLNSADTSRDVRVHHKGQGQSVSTQTVSFGGQDHTTYIDHFGKRSNGGNILEMSSREDENGGILLPESYSLQSSPNYDNLVLRESIIPINNLAQTSYNVMESSPKLNDIVFTERSFHLETTPAPETSSVEPTSSVRPHATRRSSTSSTTTAASRPTRKFRQTSSTQKPKPRVRTKVSRNRGGQSNEDLTTPLSHTTPYVHDKVNNLRYGDKVLKK